MWSRVGSSRLGRRVDGEALVGKAFFSLPRHNTWSRGGQGVSLPDDPHARPEVRCDRIRVPDPPTAGRSTASVDRSIARGFNPRCVRSFGGGALVMKRIDSWALPRGGRVGSSHVKSGDTTTFKPTVDLHVASFVFFPSDPSRSPRSGGWRHRGRPPSADGMAVSSAVSLTLVPPSPCHHSFDAWSTWCLTTLAPAALRRVSPLAE